MSDKLTFAEAMALDPSEVEIRLNDMYGWQRLDLDNPCLRDMRKAQFRRVRPRRSRVQEMAYNCEGGLAVRALTIEEAMEQAIRAVCEWLRGYDDGRTWPSTGDGAARDIEREFLEPK